MTEWTLPAAILGFEMAAMSVAWLITRAPGRSGWIDAIWSISVGVSALAASLGSGPVTPRCVLVAALVAAWSLRLGGAIARRTAGGGDDPRYVELRTRWGAQYPWRSWLLLMVQAVCAAALALSAWAAARNPANTWAWSDVVGGAVVLCGIAGETLSDEQLRRFRARHAGASRVCDEGLWSLSRHPNYFCEWLVWTGLAIVAIGPAGDWGPGWLGLVGPVLIYVLLVHVSGIPPLEAHMLRSRGAAYAQVQASISAFWPTWPRHKGDFRR